MLPLPWPLLLLLLLLRLPWTPRMAINLDEAELDIRDAMVVVGGGDVAIRLSDGFQLLLGPRWCWMLVKAEELVRLL